MSAVHALGSAFGDNPSAESPGSGDGLSPSQRPAGVDGDIYFAFGDVAKDLAGFCLTHQQAVAAQAVALAAGSPRPQAVAFGEVAPVAMMPVGDNRHDVELTLQASQWLGSSVLQPAAAAHDRERAP